MKEKWGKEMEKLKMKNGEKMGEGNGEKWKIEKNWEKRNERKPPPSQAHEAKIKTFVTHARQNLRPVWRGDYAKIT